MATLKTNSFLRKDQNNNLKTKGYAIIKITDDNIELDNKGLQPIVVLKALIQLNEEMLGIVSDQYIEETGDLELSDDKLDKWMKKKLSNKK